MMVYAWILFAKHSNMRINSEEKDRECDGRIRSFDRLMLAISPIAFSLASVIFWASICCMP